MYVCLAKVPLVPTCICCGGISLFCTGGGTGELDFRFTVLHRLGTWTCGLAVRMYTTASAMSSVSSICLQWKTRDSLQMYESLHLCN